MYKLMHTQQASKTFTKFAWEVEDLATQCQFDTKLYTKEHAMKDAIIFGTLDEKQHRETLAKDVDLATLTKTALGYEQLCKSCGAMKSTPEDIHWVNIPSPYTKEQTEQILALVIALRYSS